MNNQEMQFADPERQAQQETYNPRSINRDPREQRQWSEMSPEQEAPYGYPEAYPYAEQGWGGAGKLKLKPQKRRHIWLWFLVGLLIIILSSQFSMRRGEHPGFTSPLTQTRYFRVESDEHPVIEISDDVGNIRVHVGEGNAVIIQASVQDMSFREQPAVQINREDDDSGVIRAGVENESGFPGSGRVNFDVTVPGGADLTLKTSSGEIDVSGVTGQMSLTTDTGSIHASRDTLNGSSVLQTSAGSITFDGSLDPNGNYLFQADTGSVDVTLPSTLPFHVDATTDTGSINTTFPGLSVQHPDVTGSEVQGNVGASPNATVMLRTDTGSITLNRQ